jgi:hypothetical protein
MSRMTHRLLQMLGRRAGLLLAVGLVIGGATPDVSALTPPPPPEIRDLEDRGGGRLDIDLRWSGTKDPPVKTAGPWGVRFNISIEQTGERVGVLHSKPFEDGEIQSVRLVTLDMYPVFNAHGSLDETRYCIRVQSYLGDGTDAGSTFSDESRRKCIGTQKILIVTPAEPLPPPPPPKPDLVVTRVTGPKSLAANTTATYEIGLWNDGGPARDTAQIQISLLGPIEPVEVAEMTNGSFTCGQNEFGFVCKGSLGGTDAPLGTRGALFRAKVRGTGSGSAAVSGSANHDRALDETTVDNNMQLIEVSVS